MNQPAPILSVVIPTLNEGLNIGPRIDRLKNTTSELGLATEFIVVDGGSKDQTWKAAEQRGAQCLLQRRPGYAGALLEGLHAAIVEYVLTLDSDLSHPPELLKELWACRDQADIIIASRFAEGGSSQAPFVRHLFSLALNSLFSIGLSIPIKDLSSGYRLYKREALNLETYQAQNFNILQGILVRAYTGGFSVKEVPLRYDQRASGESHVSLVKFAISYIPTFYRLWKLRNSLNSADYEYRSYTSRHPLQRHWIRRPIALITQLLKEPKRVVDIGCGSGVLATTIPGLVAIDNEPQKIRFLTHRGVVALVADAENLPFADGSFDQAVLSEGLPYVENVEHAVNEAHRVLVQGGIAVVWVPDSHRFSWRFFGTLYGLLPNVKASRQKTLTRFNCASLVKHFTDKSFRALSYHYICGAEVVIAFQKVD